MRAHFEHKRGWLRWFGGFGRVSPLVRLGGACGRAGFGARVGFSGACRGSGFACGGDSGMLGRAELALWLSTCLACGGDSGVFGKVIINYASCGRRRILVGCGRVTG